MSEPEVTWPEGIRRDEALESFVEFFTTVGYTLCESADFEVGWQKIAIYVKDGYPTHTARQTPSRKWSSKMGFDGVDIEHDDPACLEGNQYGVATTFMRKPTICSPAAHPVPARTNTPGFAIRATVKPTIRRHRIDDSRP